MTAPHRLAPCFAAPAGRVRAPQDALDPSRFLLPNPILPNLPNPILPNPIPPPIRPFRF